MGLFYSLVSYVWKYQQPKLSENKITMSAVRLTKYIKLRQEKLQEETKKLEFQLMTMINGPAPMRSAQGESAIIENVLLNSQLFAAYEEIILCANRVKTQAKYLAEDQSKITNQCFTAICSIVFCYEAMHLEDCIQLSDFIPEPYPKISKSQLTDVLQIYMRHEKPTKYEINMYVLEMCARNQISLDKVNLGGHGFEYNPQPILKRPEGAETKSSQFFALDFEDIEEYEKEIKEIEMMEQKNKQNQIGDDDGDFAL